METLAEQSILDKIKQRETFTTTIDTGGFTIKIEKYEPAFSAAIHNGGNMRQELIVSVWRITSILVRALPR